MLRCVCSAEHHRQHLVDLVADGFHLRLGRRIGDGQRQLRDAVGVVPRVIHFVLRREPLKPP